MHTYRAISQGGTSFGTEEEIFRFAEEAARCLKERVPGTMIRGMLRVDIMQRRDGQLVVNEFESLEAFYVHTKHSTHMAEAEQFMTDFWTFELAKLM